MQFTILTLFPEMVLNALSSSILGRAQKEGVIKIDAINIRDFAENKHNQVDDYPYGGGVGMVLAVPPIYRAFEQAKEQDPGARTIYLTPKGRTFNQNIAHELSREQAIILICGHYEGIDERAITLTGAEELSIGDYVLTGGEIAAIAVVDAVSRLVDGVLASPEAYTNETFTDGLLEYPQYTRPYEFMGEKVPDILLSGNHGEIKKWRHNQSVEQTKVMAGKEYHATNI